MNELISVLIEKIFLIMYVLYINLSDYLEELNQVHVKCNISLKITHFKAYNKW